LILSNPRKADSPFPSRPRVPRSPDLVGGKKSEPADAARYWPGNRVFGFQLLVPWTKRRNPRPTEWGRALDIGLLS
jgi:hypothetical protein